MFTEIATEITICLKLIHFWMGSIPTTENQKKIIDFFLLFISMVVIKTDISSYNIDINYVNEVIAELVIHILDAEFIKLLMEINLKEYYREFNITKIVIKNYTSSIIDIPCELLQLDNFGYIMPDLYLKNATVNGENLKSWVDLEKVVIRSNKAMSLHDSSFKKMNIDLLIISGCINASTSTFINANIECIDIAESSISFVPLVSMSTKYIKMPHTIIGRYVDNSKNLQIKQEYSLHNDPEYRAISGWPICQSKVFPRLSIM